METYLIDIKQEITQNFEHILNWNEEIQSIESMDTTFLITKKNFIIVGLNSINEFLLEKIIFLYYKKYFEKIKEETGFNQYIKYELLKIEQVINNNHNGSFDGFERMIEQIIGRREKKEILKRIKDDIQDCDLNDFKGKLTEINNLRNTLGHNSEKYFSHSTDIKVDINKVEEYVNLLKSGFSQLSKKYYEKMNEFYGIIN